MLKFAICEDDIKQCQIIENLINNAKLKGSYKVEKFNSGEALVEAYYKQERYSIIFLDMQMGELDGIQTAKIIRKYDKSCLIIIITSIIEYAMDGYSINAYDFILKPVDEAKFFLTLEKAIKKLNKNKVYILQLKEKMAILKLSDIMYIESNKKKIYIHCEKKIYTNNENITVAEKKLAEEGFIRISRFYLVNMQYIKEIRVKEIILTTGVSLIYSESIRKEIKEKYMDFVIGENE